MRSIRVRECRRKSPKILWKLRKQANWCCTKETQYTHDLIVRESTVLNILDNHHHGSYMHHLSMKILGKQRRYDGNLIKCPSPTTMWTILKYKLDCLSVMTCIRRSSNPSFMIPHQPAEDRISGSNFTGHA